MLFGNDSGLSVLNTCSCSFWHTVFLFCCSKALCRPGSNTWGLFWTPLCCCKCFPSTQIWNTWFPSRLCVSTLGSVQVHNLIDRVFRNAFKPDSFCYLLNRWSEATHQIDFCILTYQFCNSDYNILTLCWTF